MYPQGGQNIPQQGGFATGQQQYQQSARQAQPPMTQTQGYGAATFAPPQQQPMQMQPGMAGQGGVGDGYEMQGVSGGNGYANGNSTIGPGSSMQQFFAEVNSSKKREMKSID